jgi:vacuolar protein sorting-associated protein 13A/C
MCVFCRWKFAYRCVLEEEVKRKRRNWDWAIMSAHRKLCKEYAEVYAAKLAGGRNDAGTLCKHLEGKLDTLNIVLIREKIELEVWLYFFTVKIQIYG